MAYRIIFQYMNSFSVLVQIVDTIYICNIIKIENYESKY